MVQMCKPRPRPALDPLRCLTSAGAGQLPTAAPHILPMRMKGVEEIMYGQTQHGE
jgi:hypothetical protein